MLALPLNLKIFFIHIQCYAYLFKFRCLHVGREIYNVAGISGFWKGIRVALVRVIWAAGINFALLNYLLPGGLTNKDSKKRGNALK